MGMNLKGQSKCCRNYQVTVKHNGTGKIQEKLFICRGTCAATQGSRIQSLSTECWGEGEAFPFIPLVSLSPKYGPGFRTFHKLCSPHGLEGGEGRL